MYIDPGSGGQYTQILVVAYTALSTQIQPFLVLAGIISRLMR